ncbi:MAG: metalloregulator ArsR/SmtB family transcription factor [bacterium]|nr:metalloregulator ArsR/SmtB family transcription factor [bacterium]
MRELIKVFKALSNETRIRMIKLLLDKGSLCVCEVMQALNISQTRASRNLGILEEAGFVISERKGAWIHYSINENFNNKYCKSIEALLMGWLNKDTKIREDRKRLSKAVKLSNK